MVGRHSFQTFTISPRNNEESSRDGEVRLNDDSFRYEYYGYPSKDDENSYRDGEVFFRLNDDSFRYEYMT